MNLYLLHNFNNYFNRIVKKISSLDELSSLTYDYITNANWNPNDGISATQVVNINLLGSSTSPDYLLCVDGDTIVSRWFILDAKRERTGQYTLSLRRDVVAEYYDQIIDGPCFIQKATLPPTDPMIFNPEGMTYNQIKKSETLLKDRSGVAWIVGYIMTGKETPATTEFDVSYTSPTDYDYTETSVPIIKDIIEYGGTAIFTSKPDSMRFQYNVKIGDILRPGKYSVNTDGDIENVTTSYDGLDWEDTNYYGKILEVASYMDRFQASLGNETTSFKNTLKSALESVLGYNDVDVNELLNLNGKVIYNSTNSKRYRLSIALSSSSDVNVYKDYDGSNSLSVTMKAICDNALTSVSGTKDIASGSGQFSVHYQSKLYTIACYELSTGSFSTNVHTSKLLNDAPYQIFCMPYGQMVFEGASAVVVANQTLDLSLNMASAIAKKLGSTYLLDMQLLPYCPLQDDGLYELQSYYTDVNAMNISGLTEGVDFQYIKNSSNQSVGVILFAGKSSNTLNINFTKVVTDVKIENECDMYRLVSPNYQGTFEFNLAKNGGVNFFNVDFTYKPFSPYIHINPNFNKLYGIDFNDSRGLICGGDFSMPIATSQWQTYELNNKNYQNIFDRQITNMEINQKYQMLNQVGNAITGTIQGGAIGGAMGGPIGAIAGAGLSAVGGILDTTILKAQQNEAKSYSIDMFNYQMGNIKALPMSLTKTSALTINNKLFPFLEYYSCTDEEKEALRNKLKWNGMTVMRIGTIRNFIQVERSFIQGQIIRLDGIDENNHVTTEIYNEISKGVYI